MLIVVEDIDTGVRMGPQAREAKASTLKSHVPGRLRERSSLGSPRLSGTDPLAPVCYAGNGAYAVTRPLHVCPGTVI